MKANKERVRILRARNCLTVSEIAKLSGLSAATTNRAINGTAVAPETIGKIAKALGVDVLDILEDESEV